MAADKVLAAFHPQVGPIVAARPTPGQPLVLALVRLDALRLRLIADGAKDRAIIAEAEERQIATRYEQLRRMAGFPQRTTTGWNFR